MKIEKAFTGLDISAMGLSAQRRRMNVIAENLANAETTRTSEGGPYRRKIVTLKEKGAQLFSSIFRQETIPLATTSEAHMQGATMEGGTQTAVPGMVETQEADDTTPPRMIYDPGHPDADANGYVQMPNVNIVTEMVNMISASRSFEANVVSITAAKNMAKDSLEI
jgi:flagellar basal-body rod protein FlgC